MKFLASLFFLLIISPLIYVASGSFGTAFAVSASDITVKGNDDTWDEGADSLNHINNGDVQIAITSNVDLNTLLCQLERTDGSIVNSFDSCFDSPTSGHASYTDLSGDYIFRIKATSSQFDQILSLQYNFDTFGSEGQSFSAAPSVNAQSQVLPASRLKMVNHRGVDVPPINRTRKFRHLLRK